MARALKVFRTSTGFHDAYVAAPSQKAALEAWGAESNLFATGLAEIVTDPRLTKEPLAEPGQVIKLVRGTAAQHLAALPKTKKKPTPEAALQAEREEELARPKTRPSRRALDVAENALGRAEEGHRKDAEAFKKREEALRREKDAMNAKYEATVARLSRKLGDARANYERALDEWRG